METLPCGTVALPARHYEIMKMSRCVMELVGPVFHQPNAPEAPIMSVTTVQDGEPINDDDPIYEGGTAESDRRFRHKVFRSSIFSERTELLRNAVRDQGRRVFGSVPDPQTLDHENRKIVCLKDDDLAQQGPVSDNIRKFLYVYDPETLIVFFFKRPDGEGGDRTQFPTGGCQNAR